MDNDEAPDPVVVGFDSATYRVGEASGTVELTVSVLSGDLTETISLSYAVSDVSTTGSDYTVSGNTLELSLMTSSVTISVAIIDDTSDEPEEAFTIELSGAPAGVSFNPTSTIVTIIDNDEAPDPVVVGFDSATYRVGEASGTVELTVSVLSGDLTETISLSYAVSDVSTTGSDYTVSGNTLELSLMTSSVTISVAIIDDTSDEPEEEFRVELSGAPAGVSFNPTSTIVTIMDNDEAPDPVVVGFDSATYRVGEASGTVELTVSVLSGDLTETISLSYAVSDVSTTGSDYTVSGNTLELSLMTSSVTISVAIIDDTSDEPEEEFRVELSGAPAGVSFNPTSTIVTIIDNDEAPDPVVVGFDSATYRVGEASGTVELTVSVLSGDLTETISLSYAVSDVSTTGSDYTVSGNTLELSLMTSSVTISVAIIDDTSDEPEEEFRVELSGAPAGVSFNPTSTIVTIIDNDEAPDPVVVGFDSATYRVGEASGTVELTVSVLSGDLTEPITLTYATSDGSAVAGVDYELATGTLTLSSRISSFTFTVMILDDLDNAEVELAETFTVSLSVVDQLPARVALTASVAIVTIEDNDEAPVVPEPPEVVVVTATLSTARLAVEEGQNASFTVRLSEVSEEDLTFTLTRVSGTASEGDDYSLSATQIEIEAGMLAAIVTITVLSDTIYELTETVQFELTVEMGTNVVLDTPSELSLELIEQFSERGDVYESIVAFENQLETCNSELDTCVVTDSGTHSEPLGLVLQDASATRDTLQELPAGYQYIAGSALADIYFVDSDGNTVSNLNGAVTITTTVSQSQVDSLGGPERISFAVLHDGETVWELPTTTSVYDADAGKYTFATTSSRFSIFALVSSPDDAEQRPTLSFDQVPDIEEGENATITVRLSAILEETVTVSLTVDQQRTTVVSPSEYELVNSSFVIQPGSQVATFVVNTNRISGVKGDRQLVLNISNDAGLEIEGTLQLVLNIRDADPIPTLSLRLIRVEDSEQVDYLFEGGSARRIGAYLTSPLGQDLNLVLKTPFAGTATSGRSGDYSTTLTGVPFRIPGNGDRAEDSFKLSATSDAVTEEPESIVISIEVAESSRHLVEQGLLKIGTLSRTIYILDNDAPKPTLSLEPVADLDEGGSRIITASLSFALPFDLEVAIGVDLVSSTAELDSYSLSPLVSTIPAGAREVTFTLETIDDMVHYGSDETPVLGVELSADTQIVGLGETRRSVTIRENDPTPALRLGEIGQTVDEGDSLTFTVEVVGSASYTQTLTLIPNLGDLNSDRADVDDLSFSPTSVTIPPDRDGSSPISQFEFTISTNPDNIYEDTELIKFELVLKDDTGVQLDQSNSIIELIDDEPIPTLSLGPVEDVTEGGVFTVTVRLSSPIEVRLPITELRYVPVGSTADMDDYVVPEKLSRGEIRIAAGMTTTVVAFQTRQDEVYEGVETLVLRPYALGGGLDLVGISGEVMIIDDDSLPNLQLGPVGEVTEGHSTTIEVYLTSVLKVPVSVSLAYGASSTAEPEDYQITPLNYQIEAGQTTATFEVYAIEDPLYELTETLVFSITAKNTEAGIELPTLSSSIEITESEELPPRIVLLAIDDPITEGGDGVTVTVRVNGAFEVPLTLSLTTAVTSVAGTDDYSLSPETIVIPAGYKQENVRANGSVRVEVEFRLTADTDDLYEGPEELALTLIVDTSADPRIDLNRGAFRRATTIIDANQPPMPEVVVVTATLRVSELSVSEGDTTTLNIDLSEPTSEDVTLTLTVVAGGSADVTVDYEPLLVPVVIRAGLSELTVSIRTIDDDVTEETETFELVLSVLSGPAVTGAVDRVTVTILDDDEAPVVPVVPELPEVVVVTATLRVSELSVSEGDTATLNIDLSEPTSEDVTLTLTVVAGGSADVTVDYEPLLVPVVIRAGLSELTVSIRTIDDDVTEETETFELVLSVLSGPAVTGAVDRVTVTILDDDEAPVVPVVPELPEVVVVTATLRVSELSVSEGDTTTLNIDLSEPASEDVTLTLTVVAGGSADVTVDYEPLLVPVVIRAGLSELTVSIRTIDDDVTEETETFELVLSVLSGPAVTGAVDRVTVSILDDDEAPVVPELPEVVVVTATLRVSELSVSEGDTTTLNIDLSEPASEDVTLTLTVVAGGSADVTVDYEPLLVPVVIRAGLSELTVSIRTIDDDVTEETETFELVLSVVDGPAVTGAVDRVTVSILDDDAPVVPEPPEVVVVTATLRVSELSVSEGDTTTLNIDLSEPASEDVTLTLTVVAGGSADVTVDYEPLLVPVVIRAGLSELTVSIRTIDDDVTEETETFELVLSVLSGPAVTGAVDRVTVSILDDDAPVVPEPPEVVVVTATLRVSELSVSEGDTTTLNIDLSTSEDVTLTLTVVAGGSADVTVDYEPLLVPVVIRFVGADGIDLDDVTEETETFELVLSVLSGPSVTGQCCNGVYPGTDGTSTA